MGTREQFAHLLRLYAPIAGAVFLVVVVVLVFVVVRFRQRPGRVVSRRSNAPRAELAYVLGIATVVVVLLVATYRAEDRVDAVAASPALRIAAVASDWRWRFDYPQQGIAEVGSDGAPTELVVPSGETVEFDLSSLDVLHAFYIPYQHFQRLAIPGTISRFDLVFPSPGVQTPGYCNELCGIGHTQMRFDVHVLSPRAFAAWASDQRHTGSAP